MTDHCQFLETFHDCADKCGLLLAGNTVEKSHAAFVVRSMNERMRKGWRYFLWPKLKRIEERAFRAPFSLGRIYPLGAEVFDWMTRNYYTARAEGVVGYPVLDATRWEEMSFPSEHEGHAVHHSPHKVPVLERHIPLRQAGRTPIGEVFEANGRDPRGLPGARPIPFTLHGERVQMAIWAPKTVWLQFRPPPPKFTLREWEPGRYKQGELFYHEQECWLVVADETDEEPGEEWPDEHGMDWIIMRIPEFLHDYLVAGVFADFLRDNGQSDKAAAQEELAIGLLDDEIAQVTKQQQQTQRYHVRLF